MSEVLQRDEDELSLGRDGRSRGDSMIWCLGGK